VDLELVMSSYRALLARPGARALALACGLGWLSFSSYALALVLAVEAASASFAVAGAAVAAFAAGSALLAPLRGRLVDRRGPRVLVALALLHAVALLTLAALCGGGLGAEAADPGGPPVADAGEPSDAGSATAPNRWPLIAAAAIAGGCAPPLIATARALWPRIAGAGRARTGHALNAALGDAAQVAGPALTGLLAAIASPLVALTALVPGVVGGALLLARAAAVVGRAAPPSADVPLATAAIPPHPRAPDVSPPSRWSIVRSSARGGRAVRPGTAARGELRTLRALVAYEVALGIWLGALEVAAPALAQEAGNPPALGALPLSLFATTSVALSLWSGRARVAPAAGLRAPAPRVRAAYARSPTSRTRTGSTVRLLHLPATPAARFRAGSLALALVLPLCLLAPSLPGLTATAAAAGAAYGLLNVALFELLDRLVAPERAVEAFTWLTSGQGAGLALGAAGAGQLAHGNPAHALLLVALPPFVGAALALLSRLSPPARQKRIRP
jgi:MFS family permease